MGVLHNLGQVAGHVLNAAPGYSTLGANITNPNINYHGAINPPTPSNNYWAPTSNAQPQPQVQGATTDTSNLSSAVSGSLGGGAATPSLTPQQISYYNQLYDTKIGGLQGQMGQLGQQRDVQNLQLQQQYQTQGNALDTQHAQGVRNLDMSGNQLADSRARSLSDIAKQVEQMGMSYNNQLGSLGAGNSSAAGLISQALAGQASRNRGDVVRNASGQQQQLDVQRGDLENEFATQKQQLDQWKQTAVADLMGKYNDNLRQLSEAIANAQGERAQQLSSYQPQLIQQAIDALGNLQQTYNSTFGNLTQQFRDASNASFNINPELQQFQVNPIDAGQVAGVPGTQPIQNEAFDPVSSLLRRRDEQGNPLPLGV